MQSIRLKPKWTATCPNCESKILSTTKEWDYAFFHVRNVICAKCKVAFRACYHDYALSHIIDNNDDSLTEKSSNI